MNIKEYNLKKKYNLSLSKCNNKKKPKLEASVFLLPIDMLDISVYVKCF